MKINRLCRPMAALLTALLLVCCFGTTAFAYEAVDTGQETSLTVYFGKGGNGFADVEFRVYRVAEVSAGARFTLTGDFADYPVKVDGLDSSGWRALAQTLEGYAARDGLHPLQTAETGRDGKAVFSHLETGLYLVTGDRYRQGRYTYTPEPFLIALPTLDEADAWVYDAVVSCKYDSSYDPPGGGGDDDTVNRKVLKVWEDDGNEDKRPDEIVVQLLRNGKVYDTVTLNAANSWRHTWTGLDDDYTWRVVEYKTPEGYTVTVEREGITFVMTNSWTEEIPDEPPPEGDKPPDEPGELDEPGTPDTPDEPGIPDKPGTPDEPGTPDTPDEPVLPQTGMLWWPVPALACAGLFLFLMGWGKRRHEKE